MLATVIIPTHDHGALIQSAFAAVCAQDVVDIEIFVIGDGVPQALIPDLQALVGTDSRACLLLYDKSPRTGERYRDEVIRQRATGRIVCYCADDDLWLPHHVRTMAALQDGDITAGAGDTGPVDFAHTLPLWVHPNGDLEPAAVDLTDAEQRHSIVHGPNRISLTNAGHTRAAYLNLPHGWRSTPEGSFTDHYMWQQWLAQPQIRARSGWIPTAIQFPSPHRREWTQAQRIEELATWQKQLHSPAATTSLYERIMQSPRALRAGERLHLQRPQLEQEAAALRAEIDELTSQLHTARIEHAAELGAYQSTLTAMQQSRGWRMLEQLRRLRRAR